MRIGNLDGRLVIQTADGVLDVERGSGGQFGPDPAAIYDRWAEFTAWAAESGAAQADSGQFEVEPFDVALLDAPSPAPRQSFGIGLNYRDHVSESGFDVPEHPSVFTKFPSCITGPRGVITLPERGHTDWEVELVVVIGRRAEHVRAADALSYVAGYTAVPSRQLASGRE